MCTDNYYKQTALASNITRIMDILGYSTTTPGLEETPVRVAKALRFLTDGEFTDIPSLFKVFDTAEQYSELVIIRGIEFYSLCEHHMLPFYGQAHVAYIPSEKRVIGASKIARLVDAFARRLQLQERIGHQVTGALMTHLQPKAAACIIEATHLCMRSRGVEKQNSEMVTSSLKGTFLDDPAARNELMMLIRR